MSREEHFSSYKEYEAFERRHIGPTSSQENELLKALGYDDMQSFISDVVPSNIAMSKKLQDVLPQALTEVQAIQTLREMADKNELFTSFIGCGYYGTITPPVIMRNVLENPAWYTAYTPYQPEISQGRLEALFAFQTAVCDLTGLPIANASMLDEGTAAAEAMTLARRSFKGSDDAVFLIDNHVHPQTRAVIATRAKPLNIVIEDFDASLGITTTSPYFAVLVQYPDTTGAVRDYSKICEIAHKNDAYVIAATDLLALTLLKPPGEWGADVAVGSAQRFGVPMGYGGPHAGFFATKDAYKRQMPGRLIGVSIDSQGNSALRMALQTREQHIKREKATSNICTAQVLLSIMASMYGVYHGPKGLKGIASRIHGLTNALANGLIANGFTVTNKNYFDTITVAVGNADATMANCIKAEININKLNDSHVSISIDETHTAQDIVELLNCLTGKSIEVSIPTNIDLNVPASLARTSDYMTHPVFNTHHSEHEMLRYIKLLESKDLSLCESMIALGSCTMKLNATAEMIPVTYPGFNALHPFIPRNQATGYTQIFNELTEYLKQVTGFAGISLQPNAGAQGEYAGLMTIREYFKAKGESHRNIALIPSSAHGTNPASAVMAGMKVIVTKTLENGYIDIEDIRAKAAEHKDNLACLMVTYPSTYGVFEEGIIDICNINCR